MDLWDSYFAFSNTSNIMIEFNLKKALAGEPVFTRDGRQVTEFHYFESATSEWVLFAVVKGEVTAYTKNGKYSNTHKSPKDLMMKAPIIETWINVYHLGNNIYLGMQFDSEEEAKNAYTTDSDCYKKQFLYIKTIKVDNLP
jgi:hypothetical protein